MKRTYKLDIDCAPPMMPNHDTYAKQIKEGLNLKDFDVEKVESKSFGNWIWIFEHDSEEEINKDVIPFLVKFDAEGLTRYSCFMTLTEEDLAKFNKVKNFDKLSKEEQEQVMIENNSNFNMWLNKQ